MAGSMWYCRRNCGGNTNLQLTILGLGIRWQPLLPSCVQRDSWREGHRGENAAWCSRHGSPARAGACGLSPVAGPARHVVFCGRRSVFCSPPEGRMCRPFAFFFTNPQQREEKYNKGSHPDQCPIGVCKLDFIRKTAGSQTLKIITKRERCLFPQL